jgi:hypothetical protein
LLDRSKRMLDNLAAPVAFRPRLILHALRRHKH